MKNKTKKILPILLALILVLGLAACSGDKNTAVSLDSMKKALNDAGYKIDDNYIQSSNDIVDGFSVIYPIKNSDAYIPVYEMQDKAAADDFAEYINDTGSNIAITNDKFLTAVSVQDESEKSFFENLINGKPLN